MEIVNHVFCMNYFPKIKVNFNFKIIRSEDNLIKVQRIAEMKSENKIRAIGEFITEKSDEEIITFFNKMAKTYQRDFDKAGFWKRTLMISDFEREIVDFLNKSIK